MANENKNKGRAAEEVVEVEAQVAPVIDGIDTTGFFTNAEEIIASDKEVMRISIDARMYNADVCHKLGGVMGYLLKVVSHKSPKAVSPSNPDGSFNALLIRTTMPCAVANASGKPERVEAGTNVLVVVTYGLKRLEELDVDPQFCAEIGIRPTVKETIPGKNRSLWRYEVIGRMKKIPRASIGDINALFAPSSEDLEHLLESATSGAAAALEPGRGVTPNGSAAPAAQHA